MQNRKTLFAPSLMCMDLLKVGEQLEIMNHLADIYHVDIMDGHYVKNFSLSPAFVASIRPQTHLPIDTHLMVEKPADFLEMCAEAGADYISPHNDCIVKDAFRVMQRIKELGCKTGLALNPANSLDEIKYYLHLVDKVTVMTVDAGFAGQKFIPAMLDKITELKELREQQGLNFLIEADGSCNETTFKCLHQAGVDVLIVGTSGFFKHNADLNAAWARMMELYHQCLAT